MTIERYNILPDEAVLENHRGEWAYIYIDDETGIFCAYSSFGIYAHQWCAIGTSSMKKFVAGLDFGYFMGKTRPDYMKFSFEASVENVKNYICEHRRNGNCSKDEARDAWEDISAFEPTESANVFLNEAHLTDSVSFIYGYDLYDICVEKPDSDSRGFWNIIWPEFLKQIVQPQSIGEFKALTEKLVNRV